MSTKIYNAYIVTYLDRCDKLNYLNKKLLAIRKMAINKFIKFYDIKSIPELEEKLKLDVCGSEASAVVYFHKKELLVQFFDCKLIESSIKKILHFEDFHYQNQSDDNLNEETRNYRKKIWDEVFNKNYSPKNTGYSFELANKNLITLRLWEIVDKQNG